MAADELRAYVAQINARVTDDEYEPEFDDKDLKKDKELRYQHPFSVSAGTFCAVLRALLLVGRTRILSMERSCEPPYRKALEVYTLKRVIWYAPGSCTEK